MRTRRPPPPHFSPSGNMRRGAVTAERVTHDPSRARTALDLVTGEVETHAGFLRKFVQNACFQLRRKPSRQKSPSSGPRSGVAACPRSSAAVLALGNRIVAPEYVPGAPKGSKLKTLLRQLPKLPDLRCAWLLLSFSAALRANHALHQNRLEVLMDAT